jgi:pimeloyl-ACP methyl ester carboxylesterase
MRTPRSTLAVLTLAWGCACFAAALFAQAAQAQIAYNPCGNSNDFACGHLAVQLDPGEAGEGMITLAIRRHRAPLGEAHSAVIALAGGPGQAALPLAEQLVELLGPVAATRDVIVFDQRGTGLSHALGCHAFERPDLFSSVGAVVAACAGQLGPSRAFFTTADSVADIEAIRAAGGYEKLLLYGTSYGTKLAEQYAQQHPERVEGLVLDSVVTPNGPDTLARSSFAAVARILRQLCASRACAHVTSNAPADLARVIARSRRAPLRGRALDGEGRAHSVPINADDLFGLLLAGDFVPELRGEFVTDVHAAAAHDTAPLARLLASASTTESEEHEDFDQPLYYATTCEEQTFPWRRSSRAHERLAEATAVVDGLPASTFAPFGAATAIDVSDLRACAGWPFAAPFPPTDDAPLPAVPTLILSGAADLRTPTADARALAAQIPGAHLLVVPYTGHSVLGDEPTECAREAMLALFGAAPGAPAKPVPAGCPSAPPPPGVAPPPLPPPQLGAVSPERGTPGRPGRTLHAVALTLADLGRQLVLAIGGAESISALADVRVGGLRSGWAGFAGGRLTFAGYAYVPAVTISGTITSGSVRLRIGGAAAAAGTLALGSGGSLTGVLGGSRVILPASSIASAAIVRTDEQARVHSGPAGRAARDLVRRLGELLTGLAGPRLRTVR